MSFGTRRSVEASVAISVGNGRLNGSSTSASREERVAATFSRI